MKLLSVKRIVQALPAFIVLATLALSGSPAQAANAANFNPGRIIDDGVFYDKNSMSAQQIQNWLNDMLDGNPNNGVNKQCDTNGALPISSGSSMTRAQWAAANGHPAPPYVCIKDYIENPTTKQNNFSGPVSGGLSAAQIIYDVSQQFNINPRVLLVLIQKESVGGVLTDDWPWASQYKTIAGYACPDGQPCDSQYFGFYNQMYNAARQFRLYANNPGNYNYIAGMNNNIKYHPSNPCGTQTVFIQNTATAGLYNYTPYVPNTAALNNLYGTGDSCSSYGNRNFWRFWTDWFGSTFAVAYSWSVESQSYGTGTPYADGVPMSPSETKTVTLKLRNTGSTTWQRDGDNPVRLATWLPTNRSSQFYPGSPGGGWLSANRIQMVEESVASNGVATFTFPAMAPGPGNYGEYFNLVAEGVTWFPYNSFIRFNFNITGDYKYKVLSQSYESGTAYNDGVPISTGQTKTVAVDVQNTGSAIWYHNGRFPIKLATWLPTNRSSGFLHSSWALSVRPTTLVQSSVQPGGTGTFEFQVTAPNPGNYGEYFNLVAEGAKWFPDPVNDNGKNFLRFNFNVDSGHKWSILDPGTGLFVDNESTPYTGFTSINPGSSRTLIVKAKNTGTATWSKTTNPVRLATWFPTNRNSAFNDPSWVVPGIRPALLQEDSVAPGGIGTFSFVAKASSSGTFRESFNLVAEGASWFDDINMAFDIGVGHTWQIQSQSYDTGSGNTAGSSFTMAPGSTATLTVVARNSGSTTWSSSTNPVLLATWPTARGNSPFSHSSWIVSGKRAVSFSESTSRAPAQAGTFTFTIQAPSTPGTYVETFNLVSEGVSWFTDPGLKYTITVQ